jgi:ABC-type phosphate/phosphonate transport system substrate-binding protein
MALSANLTMYDWPETRAETDRRWSVLRDALRAKGFEAPETLQRPEDQLAAWLSPDLLIGETCTYPLATELDGKVRYVATPVHHATGCGCGSYRSAIVRRKPGADVAVPAEAGPQITAEAISGKQAANSDDSLSGYVALQRDASSLGLDLPAASDVLWTGSHRGSIRAVANGDADFAAIDCVTWKMALEHEPASASLHVAGWTAARPGLPLITSLAFDDEAFERIRSAVLAAIDAVILERPTDLNPLRCR